MIDLAHSEELSKTIFDKIALIDLDRIDLFSGIIDLLPFHIFIKGENNELVDCNTSFANAMGVPREKLLGHGWLDYTESKELAEKYLKNDKRIWDNWKSEEIIEVMPNNSQELLTFKVPYIYKGKKVIIAVSIDLSNIRKESNGG